MLRRASFSMAVLTCGLITLGQDQGPPPQPVATNEQSPQHVSVEELDTLLAPVALYPDALLSQVLMASTYPLEVVQAQRFVAANPALTGDALADSLSNEQWDPSVKSLTNFPSVLQMMDDKLDWTVALGNAFVGQQQDVMDSVQRLRAQAQAAGTLQNTQQQQISYEPVEAAAGSPATQDIIIESADPQSIYVPVYDPFLTFGSWRYPDRRPYFWHPRDYVPTHGIGYGPRCVEGPAWGYAWGRPDWRRRDITIDVHRNENFNSHINREQIIKNYQEQTPQIRDGRGAWQHDPRYRDRTAQDATHTTQRDGPRAADSDLKARDDDRGRVEQQPVKREEPRAAGQKAPAETRNERVAPDRTADHPAADRDAHRAGDDRAVPQEPKVAAEQKAAKAEAPNGEKRQGPAVDAPAAVNDPTVKAEPKSEDKQERPANSHVRAEPGNSGESQPRGDVRADGERGRSSRSAEHAAPATPAPAARPRGSEQHQGGSAGPKSEVPAGAGAPAAGSAPGTSGGGSATRH